MDDKIIIRKDRIMKTWDVYYPDMSVTFHTSFKIAIVNANTYIWSVGKKNADRS